MDELSIFLNKVTVEGITYKRLDDVVISHKMNDHGYATVKCLMLTSDATSFIESASEKTALKISTSAGDQVRKNLFYGYVESVEANDSMTDVEGTEVIIHLASMSKKLDITKRSKTFMNDSKTYKDIMQEAADVDSAQCQITTKIDFQGISDKAIKSLDFYTDNKAFQYYTNIKVEGHESWVIQFHQTAWEFILQMASRFGACVFTDITHDSGDNFVNIIVGVPSAGKSLTDQTWVYSNIADVKANGYGASARFDSLYYGCIGDKMNAKFMDEQSSAGSGNYIITEVLTTQKDGTLFTNLTMKKKDSIFQNLIVNKALAGHMFTAEVKEVEKDKIKVHIKDIDKDYDGSTTKQFVYSTTYASKEKSGFYCMPEKEDIVRIYLPSFLERDGFASSAVNKNQIDKPEDKLWRAPDGQEILLCKDGIKISANEDHSIYIDLLNNDGIKISSTKPITISSDNDINMNAGGSVNIEGGTEVNLKVDKSAVKVTNAAVVLGAKGIYIN